MVYFFRRGNSAISCETRLQPDGHGFELVVTTDGSPAIERFATVAAMLRREHELLQAWRAQGWREVGQPPRAPDWPGVF